MDTYRASGNGGQHRNKTDSAVRLTHLPTGTQVTATEDRSQHVNRRVAFERLSAVLAASSSASAHAARNDRRRADMAAPRSFTWTGWRDEVRASDGRKARMSDALRGRLDPLVR